MPQWMVLETDYSMTVERKEVDEWDGCLGDRKGKREVRDDFPVSVLAARRMMSFTKETILKKKCIWGKAR